MMLERKTNPIVIEAHIPDNLPLIGSLGAEGLLVATGHHRNGILLAPLTADAVVALLRGDPVPDPVRAVDQPFLLAVEGIQSISLGL